MFARPASGEAAEYYFRYITLVPGDDILNVLMRQWDEEAKSFAGISEERSLYQYAPGKWTIRQLLNHVTDTERAFAFRALWFARGFSDPLPGYEQDIGVTGAGANNVSWADHVEEFRRVRLSTISLFRNMPREGWMRQGIAGGNSFTVRALAYITAGHLTHHSGVLRERYL